jgi:hypothetical protein
MLLAILRRHSLFPALRLFSISFHRCRIRTFLFSDSIGESYLLPLAVRGAGNRRLYRPSSGQKLRLLPFQRMARLHCSPMANHGFTMVRASVLACVNVTKPHHRYFAVAAAAAGFEEKQSSSNGPRRGLSFVPVLLVTSSHGRIVSHRPRQPTARRNPVKMCHSDPFRRLGCRSLQNACAECSQRTPAVRAITKNQFTATHRLLPPEFCGRSSNQYRFQGERHISLIVIDSQRKIRSPTNDITILPVTAKNQPVHADRSLHFEALQMMYPNHMLCSLSRSQIQAENKLMRRKFNALLTKC